MNRFRVDIEAWQDEQVPGFYQVRVDVESGTKHYGALRYIYRLGPFESLFDHVLARIKREVLELVKRENEV